MQTHSLNDDVSGGSNEGKVVQGAAIFFTECECTTNKSISSKENKATSDSKRRQAGIINEEQVVEGQLPGSPVDDVTDSIVKTEKSLPMNITNTIVSPIPQKRGHN